MAKLMSKKTREIVQTTAVLVVIVLFIIFYVIYPLLTVPDMAARPDRESFEDPEYMPLNDPSFFLESGLNPDTMTFLANDNIKLAAIYFRPDSMIFDSILGTVILIHPDDTDRTAVAPYIRPLLDSGLAVVAYDQRAFGMSGGRYHYTGDYEADDLVDLMAYLNIHEKLTPPILAAGFGLGGDAVLNAARDEDRIMFAIAVDPYLTSSRWIEKMKEKSEALPLPFSNIVYFWWYQKISGYPYGRTDTDDMYPNDIPTIIYMSGADIECDEIGHLTEISSAEIFSVRTRPEDDEELRQQILASIYSHIKDRSDPD